MNQVKVDALRTLRDAIRHLRNQQTYQIYGTSIAIREAVRLLEFAYWQVTNAECLYS
jgi:hypothetical protein